MQQRRLDAKNAKKAKREAEKEQEARQQAERLLQRNLTNDERAQVLRELGFASVRLNRGGIPFRGEMPDGWRPFISLRGSNSI